MLGFLGVRFTNTKRERAPARRSRLETHAWTPLAHKSLVPYALVVAVNARLLLLLGIIVAKKFLYSQPRWCRAAVPASMRLTTVQYPVV